MYRIPALLLIAAIAMMLHHVGEAAASRTIDSAVETLIVTKQIPDLSSKSGLKTSEVGDMVVAEFKKQSVAR